MEENWGLTPRERKFCEEYLRIGKKEEAAKAAGYAEKSAKNQAIRLMKKEECIAYISSLQSQAREILKIDNNWAVLRAIEIYNRCMQETDKRTFDSKGALKALELIKALLGLGEEDSGKLAETVIFIDDLGGGKNG